MDWVEVPFRTPAPGWGQYQAGLRVGVEGRSVYEKETVLSRLRGITRMQGIVTQGTEQVRVLHALLTEREAEVWEE